MKKIDLYIIRKFLGTFVLSIVLILSIAIVFDLTEKMDNFFENQVPLREIIFDYYLNFVPYYLNMFSSLFIFLSVIFFTSKMAGNSEIIAIHAAGVSYERLLRPYFLTATLLCLLSIGMNSHIIPVASSHMLAFTDKYISPSQKESARNIQMEVQPGTVLYIESFQRRTNTGYRSSLEHFDGKHLTCRITADRIRYMSDYHWRMENYVRREFSGLRESLERGQLLDTVLMVEPEEMFITQEQAPQMTNSELRAFMRTQEARGTGNVQAFATEYHKRWAMSLGAFIMTLLGLTMSSRKVRGGMGKNLGAGIALTAAYILFSTVSTTFTVTGAMSPFMAAWLPNIVYLIIGVFLYSRARR